MSLYWVATVGIVSMALIVLFFRSKRFRASRTARSVKSEWLFAATTSGTVLVLMAATVIDLLPKVTVVDIAALGVTGVLTGYFLALRLSASSARSQTP